MSFALISRIPVSGSPRISSTSMVKTVMVDDGRKIPISWSGLFHRIKKALAMFDTASAFLVSQKIL